MFGFFNARPRTFDLRVMKALRVMVAASGTEIRNYLAHALCDEALPAAKVHESFQRLENSGLIRFSEDKSSNRKRRYELTSEGRAECERRDAVGEIAAEAKRLNLQ